MTRHILSATTSLGNRCRRALKAFKSERELFTVIDMGHAYRAGLNKGTALIRTAAAMMPENGRLSDFLTIVDASLRDEDDITADQLERARAVSQVVSV